MKLGAWAWSTTSSPSENALRLSLWLVGVPFCLVLLALSIRTLTAGEVPPVPSAQRWVEQLSGATYNTAGFAEMAKRRPDFAGAQWTEVTLPDVVPIPPISETTENVPIARLWLRARYVPSADEQLAIHVTRVMGGAYEVWVNGKLIDVNLEDWRMQWNVPLFVKLPVDSVRAGEPIEVELAVPFRLSQGYAVGSMYIGPTAAIQRLDEMRVFWQNTLPKAAILITLLLGLMSLQFWFGERTERAHLMLAFCAIVWFVANSQYFGDFLDDKTSLWFSALNDAATSSLLCVMTLFSIQFDSERWPRLELGLIAYSVAITVISLPIWNWGVYALTFQHYVDLVLIFAVFGYFTWRSFARGSYEFKVIMVAVWSMPLMGLHNIYYLTAQRAPDGIHLFPYSTFILFGTFLYVMQRRYLRARTALVDLNASLDQRLRDREAELDAQHRQLMATEHQRVIFNERQRIMRDMHDGIGTALMSSLAMAEQGRLTQEHAVAVLREGLDELKLVIDSLEPVDNDIVALLANLRYRFGQRIEEAGVHIGWEMAELPPLPWLDPSRALQVLRIVQESVTNVLKHSRATEVRISARPAIRDAEHTGVVIRVTDNGRGFDPEQTARGRGLNNLRHRAAELGGELTIQSKPGRGTSIALHLPLHQEPSSHGDSLRSHHG
jgi:signal transduction histidine kinase